MFFSLSWLTPDLPTPDTSGALTSGPRGWMRGVSIRREAPAPSRPITAHLLHTKERIAHNPSLLFPLHLRILPFISLRCVYPVSPPGLVKTWPRSEAKVEPRVYGLFGAVVGTQKPSLGLFLSGYCKASQEGLWGRMRLNGGDEPRTGKRKQYLCCLSWFWW